MFPLRFFRSAIFCSIVVILFVAPENLRAQGTLTPLTTRRDMVFDFSGQHHYISTSDGFVQRYSIVGDQFDASYNLGGSLNGIDLARNDSFFLVAQNT